MRKIGDKVSLFGEVGTIRDIYKGASADIWKTDLYLVELSNGNTEKWAESVLDDFVVPKSAEEVKLEEAVKNGFNLLDLTAKKMQAQQKVVDDVKAGINLIDETAKQMNNDNDRSL